MLLGNMGMIAPELVLEKHYFLEGLGNPIALWGIRGLCIAGGIAALIVYFKLKNGKED